MIEEQYAAWRVYSKQTGSFVALSDLEGLPDLSNLVRLLSELLEWLEVLLEFQLSHLARESSLDFTFYEEIYKGVL